MIQLFIPTSKGLKVVMAENIIRIQASSNYCKVFFDNECPLTVAKVLKWFEGKLPDDCFLSYSSHSYCEPAVYFYYFV
ncbi:MAG: hypothetical protein WDO16_17730 [Bacteroidota bacterium]